MDEKLIFYGIAFIMVVSALMVVVIRNVLRSAVGLIVCLLSVAGVYILLGADFLAAAQVMLYVGGITVLILFAIMLTEKMTNKTIPQTNSQWPKALPFCAGMLAALVITIIKSPVIKTLSVDVPGQGHPATTGPLGILLLTEYLLPFEIVSLVLMAALVGAIIFSKKD